MIGIIGVGDMGLPMSGHMVAGGFDVIAHDIDPDQTGGRRRGRRATGVGSVRTGAER